MDTLFSNVTVVTMDDRMRVLPDAFVGVTDGKISHLSRYAPETPPKKIIDGTGMVLMPGLVNGHAHLSQTILRGYCDDTAPEAFFGEHMLPREARMDDRAAKASALLGIAESLRCGVTAISDLSGHPEAVAEAAAQAGIKLNIADEAKLFKDDTDEFDFEENEACQKLVRLHEAWHGYDDGRIRVDGGLHAEYTSNFHLWEAVSEYASNNGLRLHLHLSETKGEQESCMEKYGLTPAEILDCHHVFLPGGSAAHCTQLTESDMRLLAKRGVSAVHCPTADLKLGSGVADVMKLVKCGMNVCLGTGSAASNNNLDLFQEVKAAALLAKAKNEDATALPAMAALLMATVCGARAMGRDKECGQIVPGMDADLILLDFTQPHLIPCHNPISNLVYAASGHDVCMTMVRGKILYAAGTFETIDMNEVVKELSEHAMQVVFAPEEKVSE